MASDPRLTARDQERITAGVADGIVLAVGGLVLGWVLVPIVVTIVGALLWGVLILMVRSS